MYETVADHRFQSCRSIAAPRSMISISIFENLAIDDLDLDRDFSSDRWSLVDLDLRSRLFFLINFLNFKFYTINWTASIATYNFA